VVNIESYKRTSQQNVMQTWENVIILLTD